MISSLVKPAAFARVAQISRSKICRRSGLRPSEYGVEGTLNHVPFSPLRKSDASYGAVEDLLLVAWATLGVGSPPPKKFSIRRTAFCSHEFWPFVLILVRLGAGALPGVAEGVTFFCDANSPSVGDEDHSLDNKKASARSATSCSYNISGTIMVRTSAALIGSAVILGVSTMPVLRSISIVNNIGNNIECMYSVQQT